MESPRGDIEEDLRVAVQNTVAELNVATTWKAVENPLNPESEDDVVEEVTVDFFVEDIVAGVGDSEFEDIDFPRDVDDGSLLTLLEQLTSLATAV